MGQTTPINQMYQVPSSFKDYVAKHAYLTHPEGIDTIPSATFDRLVQLWNHEAVLRPESCMDVVAEVGGGLQLRPNPFRGEAQQAMEAETQTTPEAPKATAPKAPKAPKASVPQAPTGAPAGPPEGATVQ